MAKWKKESTFRRHYLRKIDYKKGQDSFQVTVLQGNRRQRRIAKNSRPYKKMYHRRTAVFLLSSGIFKTHEERPGRLVEFTLCHVVACRPIRRFSPVKVCYRPFSQITRSYFRVSFPYMHHPLRLTREPGTGYIYPELFSKSF